jgi:gas vesicle protein
MSENKNNKLFLAFLAGAAVGAAIGYLMNSDKKDEILSDLKQRASNLKQGINEGFEKAKDLVDSIKNVQTDTDTETQNEA